MISFLSNKKKIFFNFLFVQQCMFGEAAKVYEKLEDPLRLPGISNNLHTVIQYLFVRLDSRVCIWIISDSAKYNGIYFQEAANSSTITSVKQYLCSRPRENCLEQETLPRDILDSARYIRLCPEQETLPRDILDSARYIRLCLLQETLPRDILDSARYTKQ